MQGRRAAVTVDTVTCQRASLRLDLHFGMIDDGDVLISIE
jgi:hypothetical protein